jgi:nicotinic acid mononucleotide adenylyltransferase
MSAKKVVHVWYGGNFSPPTNAHIYGSLAIAKHINETLPDVDEIRIYWTPTSKNENDGFIKQECVSEKDRVRMLEILRDEFNNNSPKNVSVIINETGMVTGLPLILVDNIQVMIHKYNIYNSDNQDLIYAVLSQYVFELALDGLIKFSNEIISQFNLLVYPNEEVIINNKILTDQLINNYRKKAAKKGISTLNMGIIPYVVPTKDALIVRSAAKTGDKETILKYTPRKLADYIIRRKLYKNPKCNIFRGGQSRRRRLKRQQTRRR